MVGFKSAPMIYEILKVGDPILRQTALPVTKFDAALKQLAQDMLATMYINQGVGLAAPQIGLGFQMVVIGCEKRELVLINPQIIKCSGETLQTEGCLSVPEAYGYVRRYDKITVEAYDVFGKKKTYKEAGFFARVVQHELDHLDGVLFIDKVLLTEEVESLGLKEE